MANRVHSRTDLQFQVIKGNPHFSRCAYAVIVSQEARDGARVLYHVETFYGQNGVTLRAEARRFGRDLVSGRIRIGGFRNQYLPCEFPHEGVPATERDYARLYSLAW